MIVGVRTHQDDAYIDHRSLPRNAMKGTHWDEAYSVGVRSYRDDDAFTGCRALSTLDERDFRPVLGQGVVRI